MRIRIRAPALLRTGCGRIPNRGSAVVNVIGTAALSVLCGHWPAPGASLYRFQALVTSLPASEPPLAVWRYYNGRADCEPSGAR